MRMIETVSNKKKPDPPTDQAYRIKLKFFTLDSLFLCRLASVRIDFHREFPWQSLLLLKGLLPGCFVPAASIHL